MDGAAQKEDKDAVADIFREAQLLPAAEEAGVLNDDEFVRRMSEVLDEITRSPANRAAIVVRGRAGHYHFKVKKVLWQTLIIGIQTAVGALDPSHLTKAGMIIQIMNYLNTLKTFAAALTESEVEVYDAVCEIVRSKAKNGLVLEAKSASQQEIALVIQQTGGRVLPSQLKDVLDGLVAKGGITHMLYESGHTGYISVF